MTVKQFFKSNAFKSLAVLLAIVIIAGGLLAIFNDLLFVSDEERFNRTIEKIYGGSATVEETLTITDENGTFDKGAVSAAYKMSDGNYLIHSSGKGGYGGDVYLWVVVIAENGKFGGIEKVLLDTSDGETLLGNFRDSFYENFTKHNDELVEGKYFGTSGSDVINNVVTGTTLSSNAMCNAVNTAIDFFKSAVLGEEVVSYTYLYEKYVDMTQTTIERDFAANSVTLRIVMQANGIAPSIAFDVTVKDGAITAFEATKPFVQQYDETKIDESLRNGTYFVGKTAEEIAAALPDGETLDAAKLEGLGLATGASRSSESFFRAAAFATANFEAFFAPENLTYASYVDFEQSTFTWNYTEGNEVKMHIVMQANGIAPSIAFDVTVKDGAITAFEATKPFVQQYDETKIDESLRNGTYFVGKTAEEIAAALPDGETLDAAKLEGLGLATGASRSSESFFRAAAFATANFEAFFAPENLTYASYVDFEQSTFTWNYTEGNEVKMHIVMQANGIAPSIAFDVTVKDGAITAFEATKPFVQQYDETKIDESLRNGTYFVGKTLEEIAAALPDGETLDPAKLGGLGLATGASRSSESFFRAAAFALSNYTFYLTGGEQA